LREQTLRGRRQLKPPRPPPTKRNRVAQADLAQSPEERADVLQKQLEIYAEAEDNLQKQIKEGKAESADLDHLRYQRLGVEIDLEILRRGIAE
jgi:outer membrane protein TolC